MFIHVNLHMHVKFCFTGTVTVYKTLIPVTQELQNSYTSYKTVVPVIKQLTCSYKTVTKQLT